VLHGLSARCRYTRLSSPVVTVCPLGRWGAKFGCIVLLASLVMLAVANFIHAPLWAITLAAAGVLVAGNLWVHYVRPWVVAQRQRHRTAAGGGGSGGSTGSSAPDSGREASGSAAAGAAAGSSSAADPEAARSSGGATAEQAASPGGGGAVKGRGGGVLQHAGAGDAEAAAAEGPAIELVVLAHHGDATGCGGVTGAEPAGGKHSSGDAQLHDGGNLRRRTSAGMDGGGGGQNGIVPLAELGEAADAASATYIETVCTCSMSRFLLKR